MTQEEKAKAYDIALDKIKRLLGSGSNCSREDLEHVFPELKESEDERIRKNIISYLALYKDVIGEEYESWLAWLEKQGEQKPADKAEPKFKVGDWVVNTVGDTNQVVKVLDDGYTLDDNTFISNSWVTEHYNLWTIQDAKDGDVLIYGKYKRPFIFKGLLDNNHPENPVAYCGIDDSDVFAISSGDAWWTCEEVQPSTKEQRDLFFQEMKEAGYEWDSENKELNEIRHKSAWTEEDEKFFKTALWHISYSISNGKNTDVHCDTTDWFKSLKERVQPQPKQEWKQENTHDLTDFENVMMHIGDSFFGQYAGLDPNDTIAIKEQATILLGLVPKQEWSEEDEHRINDTIYFLETAKKHYASTVELDACIDWLKSLRPQSHWKPSEEQITWLYRAADEASKDSRMKQILNELLSDLKKLMEE